MALSGQATRFENYSTPLDKHYEVFAYQPAPRQFAVVFTDITARKQAEAALRDSERRYHTLFDSLQEGFYLSQVIFDNDGKPIDFAYLDVNPAFERMMGLPRDQIVGHRAKELVPGLKPGWVETFSKVQSTGEPASYDTYSDFFKKHFEAFVFRPAQGQFAVLVSDITERKRAEEALRELSLKLEERVQERTAALSTSEQEFRSLAEAMPQIVWVTRPDGWNIYFNQQWADYTGMTMEESHGHGWNAPFHPDDKQRAWEAWQRATQYNEPYSLECRLRRADGVYRWWLIRGSPMLGVNGEILKWFGTCTDIEEIKLAEAAMQGANDLLEQRVAERTAALQESERRERERAQELAVMFEAVPVPVFIAREPECMHMTGNRLADEILRIPHGNELSLSGPAETKPVHFRPLKDGRELRLDELPAQRAARGEHVKDFELTLAFDDGVIRHVLGYGTPLPDEQGRPRGTVAVLMDITDRKRAEEMLQATVQDLERSNKELEQFAYIASHDLQEPLRQVRAYVNMLKDRHADKFDGKAGQYFQFVYEGAARMSDLVQGLLAYSRVGAKDARKQPTSCHEAMDTALANLQTGIAESRARVTHDDLPTVQAEPTQLTQLFQNLIGNAVKFHRDGEEPQIHVGCRRDDGHWVFQVRDNGIGIDPDHHEKVFLIFQRLHGRDKYPGTGIGLAICKKIVEQHGGKIWIESTVGQGSTFCFTLPEEGTRR